jgi:hypothetical protein
MRALQIVVRSLPIGLRSLPIRLSSFEVGLRALKIRMGTLALSVCAFEIGLRASAFGRDRFLQLATRLGGRVRGSLFGLASCARHRFGQGAFDIRPRRSHF